MDKDLVTLKASYIVQGPGEVINGGQVTIKGPKIVEVGPIKAPMGKVIDLGGAAVIPGLINAHTHLELTDLEGKIPPPKSFTHWLRHLVSYRRGEANKDLGLAVKRGANLSMESGTTAIADISSTGDSLKLLPEVPIRKRVFKEVICMDPAMVASILEEAIRVLSDFPRDGLGTLGLSPHAPYTACAKLYQGCTLFSKGQDLLLSTHICETKEELEFLKEGTGSFAIMLRAYGMLEGWEPPGLYPLAYLKKIGALARPWLLIHCNYLSEEDIYIIKESGSSVVYCPRSHHFFGHEAHPFLRLLKEGINVALGTDSLASNKSLSMIDEIRFLLENSPGLSPQEALSMATVRGARALGIAGLVGELRAGYEADLAVIELPRAQEGPVLEDLFDPESRNIVTLVAGRPCYDRYGLLR